MSNLRPLGQKRKPKSLASAPQQQSWVVVTYLMAYMLPGPLQSACADLVEHLCLHVLLCSGQDAEAFVRGTHGDLVKCWFQACPMVSKRSQVGQQSTQLELGKSAPVPDLLRPPGCPVKPALSSPAAGLARCSCAARSSLGVSEKAPPSCLMSRAAGNPS